LADRRNSTYNLCLGAQNVANPFESDDYSESMVQSGLHSVRLKRVGILSMGLFCGVTGALMGLLGGAMMFVFSLAAGAGVRGPGVMLGVGAGALIMAPIMYGILGFIGGCLNAALYNVVAGLSGGIEMDFGP
jgi:hypothetical protein